MILFITNKGKVLKNQNLLDLSKKIFDQVTLDKNIEFEPFCGLLGKELYLNSMGNKYFIAIETVNKKRVEEYFDTIFGFFKLGKTTHPFMGVVKNSLTLQDLL